MGRGEEQNDYKRFCSLSSDPYSKSSNRRLSEEISIDLTALETWNG
jgi:hypothetical protein